MFTHTLIHNRQAFEDLLKAQLQSIAVIAEDRHEALKYIKGDLDAQGQAFGQERKFPFCIAERRSDTSSPAVFEMLMAGHDMNEPQMHSMLQRFQQLQYNTLRKKLAIKVYVSFKYVISLVLLLY